MTLMRGKHSFRSAPTSACIARSRFPSVHSAGQYAFARNAVLTRQLDNSPAAAIGQDMAAMLLGESVGRHHRPQRRPLQPGDLRRRVRPGRLEGQQQADRQPRAALGVRGGADRAREPERARLRSRRDAEHHGGGAGGVRGQPDPGDSGAAPSASAAGCSSRSDEQARDPTTPTSTTSSRASASPTS